MNKKPSTLSKLAKIKDWIDLPNGGKLFLLPISQQDFALLAGRIKVQFEKSDEFVEQPYYWTVEPSDNDPGERVYWDDKSLEKSGTEEEKEWMTNYLRSQDLLIRKQEQASSFLVYVDGTKKYITPSGKEFNLVIDDTDPVFKPPVGWLRKQERLGFTQLEDDPYEAKFNFINSLIPDIEATQAMFAVCIELSLQGALTHEASDSFRRGIQREMEKNARRASQKIIELEEKFTESDQQDRVLDVQQSLPGNESSEGLEVDSDSVGPVDSGRQVRNVNFYLNRSNDG